MFVIDPKYDKSLITHKLSRWDAYLANYALPAWDAIPDIGLYMDQVISLLRRYLNFIPEELPSERPITSTTINNYVRLKIMPAPEKRKYYRVHVAYLIMIFTLKQSISISGVQELLPADLPKESVHRFYDRFRSIVDEVGKLFLLQTRQCAGDILSADTNWQDDDAIERLVIIMVLMGGFSGILAQKLLYLKGADKEAVLEKELE